MGFQKGTMRDSGDNCLDVTIKNNPGHVLAPDSWDVVMGVKSGKISSEEYKEWYKSLLKERWSSRKREFIDLINRGKSKTIILKCFCPKSDKFCHAYIASDFLNKILELI